MEVTSVDIKPMGEDADRVLAFASIVFDDEFVVHNVRLVRARSGIIVAMPNEEYRGDLRDVAHPLNNECRGRIREAVIETYNETVDPEKRIQIEG